MSRFLRTEGNYDPDQVSYETGLACEDPSKTIQSHAVDADINTIAKNFGLTGKMPENIRTPVYDDFTVIDDYRSAVNAVREADAAFMAIPAPVRARFENDPQQFLEFCTDPRNLPELRTLGLAPPSAAVPAPVPASTDTTASTPTS